MAGFTRFIIRYRWPVIVLWVVLMLGFAPVHLHNVFSEGAAS